MATKTTKRALLVSVISLFVCFTMLIGTTYAWFTDSVTSAGNIIKTGTLDVTLEYKTPMDANWSDASNVAIFKHDNWEPGYTEVRHVRISNVGSLDFKFILNVIPDAATVAGEPNLADVIEVYVFNGVTTVTRDVLTEANTSYKGVLSSLMNVDGGVAQDVAYADDADKPGDASKLYTIVLKMKETAGNDFQGKSYMGIGVTVYAVQGNVKEY